MTRPSVVFVCVHNAGRSQMAAALMEHHAMGRVEVRSAGSAPTDVVNPAAVEALREWGVEITRSPRLLTHDDVASSTVAVTMGCGDACPVVPGVTYDDWPLADPAGEGVAAVRVIRDEIDRRVRRLLSDMLDAD